MAAEYIHHGLMFSYYSAKTRAYMSYKRIPFVETLDPANGKKYQETTGKGMIPVVETPTGEILQDTTDIIDRLEADFPSRPVMPDDPMLMLVTRIVEFILDELWIVTSMHSRWNDPVSKTFVMSEMSRVIGGSNGLKGEEAKKIGDAVAGQMQSYLPMLGVADPGRHAQIEALFESASTALNDAVGPHRYAFGKRPSLIDFCLFTAYYAHQYRDAGKAQMFLKTKTPDLAYYLDALHAGHCAPDQGELELDDTFVEYLRVIGPIGAGFAQALMKRTEDLAASSEPGPFEKSLGLVEFDLNGEYSRGASTFNAWKLQRAMDCYEAAKTPEADALLEDIGWFELLNSKPGYRLKRDAYKVNLA